MGLNERQRQILEWTEKKQRISVSLLAKKLYVSEMTVRRDLDKMEQEGFLRRYHGGAVANSEHMQDPIDLRMHVNEKEKRDLAKKAEAHLQNGQTVFLPGCSTCAFLIPYLKKYENIHVITNSIQFLTVLSKMRIRCTLTGGEYYEKDKTLVGRDCENFLRSINTDIAFLACDGISDDGMVTIKDESQAALVRIGFRNSAKRVILSDRSKLGAKYTYNICHTDEADEIIVI
jgi:DeoR family fructose operon transcriptional repressor